MRYRKNMWKRIEIIVMAICLLGMRLPQYTVEAAQTDIKELPQNIAEKQNAAVKLIVSAVTSDQKSYNIRQGTGTLVGMKGDSGETSEIVLTNDKLIRVEDSELNNIRLMNGLPVETEFNIQVDVMLHTGTRVQLEEKYSGNGFVVLEFTTDVQSVECINLGNSADIILNERLYMLGYTESSSLLGQEQVTNPVMQCGTGIVSSVAEDSIVTDYQPQESNVGMPVLNADGYMVGMFVNSDAGLIIQPIDSIKKELDVLGISYLGIDTNNHYNEVTEDIRQQLNTLLYDCQEEVMKDGVYTKKSVDKLKDAINTAMEVMGNSDSTYDQYQGAIEGLQKNQSALKKADYPIRVLQIVLMIAIILFCGLGIRARYVIKHLEEENKYNVGGAMTNNEIVYAKLLRVDNGQEVPISNVIFRIGKHVEDVDYVIEDVSVSRHHADIMRKGKEFYIMDNNSTNHTYVNGEQIISGQYKLLHAGDRIRLADVEFEFEL